MLRIYLKGRIIKTHPVMESGKRSTDFEDYPKEKAPYAMRQCGYYIEQAKDIGKSTAEFMQKLLSGDFPWFRVRQAQKLLRLKEKYGISSIENACSRAMQFDLIEVPRLEKIINEGLSASTEQGYNNSRVIRISRYQRTGEYFKQKEGGKDGQNS